MTALEPLLTNNVTAITGAVSFCHWVSWSVYFNLQCMTVDVNKALLRQFMIKHHVEPLKEAKPKSSFSRLKW